MKIYIFRHGKVNMKWPSKCTSQEFDRACSNYDSADIFFPLEYSGALDFNKIYVSNLLRSLQTAQSLFPAKNYEIINIDEVPLKSFTDSSKKLPLWIWNVAGRLQWFFNNKRQSETRTETEKRSETVIEELHKKNENCVIISHGFFMRTFIKSLKKQGFKITGDKKIRFSNLQMIIAENSN